MRRHRQKHRKTALLAIGDISDYDSFLKLDKNRKYIRKLGLEYLSVSYDQILKGKALDIGSDAVIIFPFFPFKYWNRNIERRGYKGLYGNISFREKFAGFCREVERKISGLTRGRSCFYINDMKKCAYYRDKRTVMSRLKRSGVSVPDNTRTSDPGKILRMIEKGGKFFIKPRCGSMGKGITYMEKDNWRTNFRFRAGKLGNIYSDYGWKFRDVTGKRAFVDGIAEGDFVIEQAVDPFLRGRNKVDFRVYVFNGEVLFIYPRMNSFDNVTTNISQGGRGCPGFVEKIPAGALRKIKGQALKAAKSLGLGFCGIDVLMDSDMRRAYVIDVNMFPGFPKRRTFNLARSIVDRLNRIDAA